MINKEEIKKKVVLVIDEFCKDKGTWIEFEGEGTCSNDRKMFFLNELNEALDLCFEITYNETIKTT
jgi:hypothetical protein